MIKFIHTKSRTLAVAAGALLVLGGFGQSAVAANGSDNSSAGNYPAVTQKRLMNAEHDKGWLMYRRDYSARAYAPFSKIDKKNVKKLKVAFDYKTGLNQGHEAAPIVNGNYMYITTPLDHLIALNATSGKVLWKYQKHLADAATKTVCCDVVNRGVALSGDMVYMATLDNYVVALDAKTGKVQWKKQLHKAGVGYAMTLAPLALNGKIIVGVAGGEYGARGFIEALDAKTGKKAWKTYTIPAPNQPGGKTWPKGAYKTGGGGAWLTGSYDQSTDTLFWSVGNPSPWLATLRPGRNLYTDSVLAINPSNGHIKWHYQFTPHDTWDYDGTNGNILVNIKYKGKPYKAIVHADRNGWLYAIDRTNGDFIYAKPFVKYHTSVIGFHSDGTPKTNPAKRPTVNKQIFTCPAFLGGKNWWPISVDQDTHMAYVPTRHACMVMKGASVNYIAGLPFLGETFTVKPTPDNSGYGSIQGIDLNTGKQVWQHKTHAPWNDGTLVTASGLVFSGSAEGHFYAFDAKSGKVLWKSKQLTSGIIGVPTTYMVNGKQYVAVYAGWGGATPIWGGEMAKDKAVKSIQRGGHLYVFTVQ